MRAGATHTSNAARGRPPAGTALLLAVLAAGTIATARWGSGRAAPAAAPGPARTRAWRVDLNRATAAELELLPGIGPALAGRIEADRGANGPYASVEDLSRVPGVGPALLRRVGPLALAGVAGPGRVPAEE